MAKKIFEPIDGGTLEGLAKVIAETNYGLNV